MDPCRWPPPARPRPAEERPGWALVPPLQRCFFDLFFNCLFLFNNVLFVVIVFLCSSHIFVFFVIFFNLFFGICVFSLFVLLFVCVRLLFLVFLFLCTYKMIDLVFAIGCFVFNGFCSFLGVLK